MLIDIWRTPSLLTCKSSLWTPTKPEAPSIFTIAKKRKMYTKPNFAMNTIRENWLGFLSSRDTNPVVGRPIIPQGPHPVLGMRMGN